MKRRYKTPPCMTIHEAVRNMKEIAVEHSETLTTDFNDIEIVVTPTTLEKDAVNHYHKRKDERALARKEEVKKARTAAMDGVVMELERMKEERDRLKFRLDFLESAGEEKDGWCEHERRYQRTSGGDGDHCYICERDRLKELLESTKAQLLRTQGERNELSRLVDEMKADFDVPDIGQKADKVKP